MGPIGGNGDMKPVCHTLPSGAPVGGADQSRPANSGADV